MLVMKSVYFTSTDIQRQAEEFLRSLGLTRSREISWGKPGLLVLDMQEYFLHPGSHSFVPSATAILPGILDLIEAFQFGGLPVIFTQHLNTDSNAGMMGKWWRDVIRQNHNYAGLSKQIQAKVNQIIEKTQYDAFFGTDLNEELQKDSVTDLVITGVMTHLCCETTARSGFMHGYRIWFSVDGTATYNPEFHLASLRNLSHGFATPVLVSELLEALA
jgi:bifunctional isochorismate lyase/aryl carrier protein